MEENFLPSDLKSSLNNHDNEESHKPIVRPQPLPFNYGGNIKPINQFNYGKPSSAVQEFDNEKTSNVKPKKINFFVKMSNFIARRPKVSLGFIICLILCILILIIYYRGMLFLGPYCPNNIKSKKYKMRNDDIVKPMEATNDSTKILKSLR